MKPATITKYAEALACCVPESSVSLDEASDHAISMITLARDVGRMVMFIGNGGSAAIASHLATDYCKNGGIRSLAFNDLAALTCYANDFGYEFVFAKQIEMHARKGDLLIAISSSGQSPSILNAVKFARAAKIKTITLSGFEPDNPLRSAGDLNFYVPSSHYGMVEISHLILAHGWLDLIMGFGDVSRETVA